VRAVLDGSFEAGERKFVQRFLQSGMTALDIEPTTGSIFIGFRSRRKRRGTSSLLSLLLPTKKSSGTYELIVVKTFGWKHCACREESEQTLFSVPGESAGYSGLRRPEVGANVEPILCSHDVGYVLRLRQIRAVDLIKD